MFYANNLKDCSFIWDVEFQLNYNSWMAQPKCGDFRKHTFGRLISTGMIHSSIFKKKSTNKQRNQQTNINKQDIANTLADRTKKNFHLGFNCVWERVLFNFQYKQHRAARENMNRTRICFVWNCIFQACCVRCSTLNGSPFWNEDMFSTSISRNTHNVNVKLINFCYRL